MRRAPNFDHLARLYRWMERFTFGNALWHCRCGFLGRMHDARHALLIGDGDGRFAARLLAENGAVQVDAVDASRAMLAVLLENAGPHAERVLTQVADIRTWEPYRTDYDLVVTHFSLDCLTTEEIAATVARLRRCVTPSARWAVSEFAVPAGWFGKLVAGPLILGLYVSFRVLTGLRMLRLPDYRKALASAGFVVDRAESSLCGLLVSEVWTLRDGV
ncbi:MAG: class I SAM-dependent methyltransferase [Terracidiphilus sp.]